MPEGLRAGRRTYWREAGTGGRAAVLIHCTLAHSGAWSRVMARLEDDLRMTAFDMPGHGRSADWDGGPDLQGETAAVAATFCDGPTDLVGHSFGATVALRLALDRPELARSLTLVEPVLFSLARGSEADRQLQSALAPYAAAIRAEDRATAARAFNRVWGTGVPWDDLPPGQRDAMVERIGLIEAGTTALDDDIGGTLALGRLEALAVPVLLIEGGESPAVVRIIHDRLEARLPKVERVRIAGASHLVPATHPEPVAAAIRGFLSL